MAYDKAPTDGVTRSSQIGGSNGMELIAKSSGNKIQSLRWIPQCYVVYVLLLSSGVLSAWRSSADVSYLEDGDPVLRAFWLVTLSISYGWALLYWKSVVEWAVRFPFLSALHFLAAISVIWSEVPELTIRRVYALFGSWLFAMMVVSVIRPERILSILSWILVILMLGSIVAIFWYPEVGIDQRMNYEMSWKGLFIQKNQLGSIVGMGCLVWVWRIWLKVGSRRFAIAVVVLGGWLLLMSGSVTPLVATIVAVMVLFVSTLRWNGRLSILGLTMLFSVVVVVAGLGLTLVGGVAVFELVGRDGTFTGRSTLWRSVWSLIADRPWLGYGFGSFWRGLVGPSAEVAAATRGFLPATAHNGLLEVGLGLGLLGIYLFVMTYLSAVWGAIRCYVTVASPRSICYLSYLVFFGVYNSVESTVLEFSLLSWILFMIVVYLIIADLSGDGSAT